MIVIEKTGDIILSAWSKITMNNLTCRPFTCKYLQNLQTFGLKLNKMGNFHPLEVVGLSGETQLHVGEKLGYLF